MSFRHLVSRHQALPVVKFEVAPISDFQRVADSLRREILQHLAHLVDVFEVEVVVKLQPSLVVDGFLRLDAEEDIVHTMVCFPEVVAVIRADKRQIVFLRQLHHYRVGGDFLVNVVVLHLNVEVAFTHNVLQFQEVLNRFFTLV